MPGLQGERAGQEASLRPLGSLCSDPTTSSMPTPVSRRTLGQRLVSAFVLPRNNLIWGSSWKIEGPSLMQTRTHLYQDCLRSLGAKIQPQQNYRGPPGGPLLVRMWLSLGTSAGRQLGRGKYWRAHLPTNSGLGSNHS